MLIVIWYINISEEIFTIWIIESKFVQRRYRFNHDLERPYIIVYRYRNCWVVDGLQWHHKQCNKNVGRRKCLLKENSSLKLNVGSFKFSLLKSNVINFTLTWAPEPPCRVEPNMEESILWWRGFKFDKIMGHTLF